MSNEQDANMKRYLQSGNINLLIGSGCSSDLIKTLHCKTFNKSVEELLESDVPNEKETGQELFVEIMKQCLENSKKTGDYKELFKSLYKLISKRGDAILTKQTNVFTTNYDLLIENTLEELNYIYNDGFLGKINPIFSTGHFNYIFQKRSAYNDQIHEVPVFNVYKLHGSISWKEDEEKIILNRDFEISNYTNYEDIEQKLSIIIPKKTKFSITTLELQYYDLLRMFANELERKNAVLLVMGFSFADEHIRTLVQRSLTANPSLQIFIFCYNENAKQIIKEKISDTKITFLCGKNKLYKNKKYDLKSIVKKIQNDIKGIDKNEVSK